MGGTCGTPEGRGGTWSSSLWCQICSIFSSFSIPDIHAVRPHRGQIEVAFRFRSLLDSDHHPSEIAGVACLCERVYLVVYSMGRRSDNLSLSLLSPTCPTESHRFCDRVQDAYTLRCCPQVKSKSQQRFFGFLKLWGDKQKRRDVLENHAVANYNPNFLYCLH